MLLSLLLVVPLIFISFYLPIYSDELLYKWFSGRLWLDNGVALGLFPHCVEEFSQKTPKLFLVSRLFDSYLYSDIANPLIIRVFGILSFIIWLTLLFFLCRRLITTNFERHFLLKTSLMFFGTLPIMMTLNRPEQALIVAITASCFLPLIQGNGISIQIFLISSFSFLVAWFFPQHPKTLLFLPFFLTVCFFLPIRRAYRFGLTLWIFVMAYSSFSFYSVYHACPLNPDIEQLFSATLISPSMFLKMPWFYTKQVVRNLFSISKYFNAISFSESSEASWLPPIEISLPVKILNFLMLTLLAGWLIDEALRCCRSLRKQSSVLNLDFRAIGCSTLYLAAFSLVLLQTTKSFYNSTLFFPILILAGMLGNKKVSINTSNENLRKSLSYFTIGLSFVSLIFAAYLYLPKHITNWQKGGQLEFQYNSFSAFKWNEVRERVLRLSAQCNLENRPSTKHLVVDDITYPFFIKSVEPYHIGYITGFWSIGISDLSLFLKTHQSAGLISQCKYLPTSLVSQSLKDGYFCCLPAFK